MDSHEYAERLKVEAAYLLDKPAFIVPNHMGAAETYYWYMFDKEPFIEAVRALGAGEKKIGTEYVDFHPTGAPFFIRIERNYVCKLVKPAEYDCEPFLKPGDHTVIDEAAAAATTDTEVAAPPEGLPF